MSEVQKTNWDEEAPGEKSAMRKYVNMLVTLGCWLAALTGLVIFAIALFSVFKNQSVPEGVLPILIQALGLVAALTTPALGAKAFQKKYEV